MLHAANKFYKLDKNIGVPNSDVGQSTIFFAPIHAIMVDKLLQFDMSAPNYQAWLFSHLNFLSSPVFRVMC